MELEAPKTETVRETVFSSDETADAAMNGIYLILREPDLGLFSAGLELTTGLLSDELVPNTTSFPWVQYAANEVDPNNATIFSTFWRKPYNVIYNANAIIEGVTDNDQITVDLRNHLHGEALFIRALMHFYLTNLFGAIPYSVSTNIEENNRLNRETTSQVYGNIIADVLEAQSLMFDHFDLSDGLRARANSHVASALLARTYLYAQDWVNAELVASEIISQSELFQMESIDNVFLANNTEAIFQLASISSRFNENVSPLGDRFVISRRPAGLSGLVSPDEVYIEVYDSTDLRFTTWIGSYTTRGINYLFSNKYKNHRDTELAPPEKTVVFRLAEQYLIRSEARAQLNNLSGAIEDIDVIRERAGLPLIADSIPGISRSQLLLAIEQERQREFIAEGGHRWFDLKRTGKADQVLSTLKEGWAATDVLLPIPESELARNANLLPQNEGY